MGIYYLLSGLIFYQQSSSPSSLAEPHEIVILAPSAHSHPRNIPSHPHPSKITTQTPSTDNRRTLHPLSHSVPLQVDLAFCANALFYKWQKKSREATIAHLSGAEDITFPKEPELPSTDPCRNYSDIANQPIKVLPFICTQCNEQIRGGSGDNMMNSSQPIRNRSSHVTLAIPMTDTERLWLNLRSHAERWGGPISVALMLNDSEIIRRGGDKRSVQYVRTVVSSRAEQYLQDITTDPHTAICFHVILPQVSMPLFGYNHDQIFCTTIPHFR